VTGTKFVEDVSDDYPDIRKARELVCDDQNFSVKGSTLIPEMLQLLHYSRAADTWEILFRVKNYQDYLYECTYDEKTSTAVVWTYRTTNSSIIHE
jgi:hypothetical protein